MTAATVQRIAGFGLTSRDAEKLGEFYTTAFDCRLSTTERVESEAFEALMSVRGGAQRRTLTLGNQILEILQFETPGRPYHEPLSPYDTSFQHLALVVSDIDEACRRLGTLSGWTAISTLGPQLLPPSTGNVKAYKFRDPEGHPLEFLEFPAAGQPPHSRGQSGDLFLGIDHSALSVRDVQTSLVFYERLGFRIAARTLNQGLEQERLDGIVNPQVDVVALAPASPTPHVELLHYRTSKTRRSGTLCCNDLAATRVMMETTGDSPGENPSSLLRDPDGHLLQLSYSAP